MRPIVGIDGCPAGWVAIVAGPDPINAVVASTIEELAAQIPRDAIVAIDIPIGLPDAGARACDLEARKLLGQPRGSSVFPAPVRSTLGAKSYAEACELHAAADGRRMSQQAFAILGKIREVDDFLRGNLARLMEIREVHPELCFWAWNDRKPIRFRKKSAAGRAEREQLIETVWPGVRQTLRARFAVNAVSNDDLNDAFAALWTACRIRSGKAHSIPAVREWDGSGRLMEVFI